MQLYVVAERPSVMIFNRASSARGALEIAGRRRMAGADAVFVYDAAWILIEAQALDAAARREGAATVDEGAHFTTFTIGKRTAEISGAEARAQGRVRVFRGRRSDDRSDL